MTLGVLIGLFVGAMLMYFYNSRRKQKKEELENEECVKEVEKTEEGKEEDEMETDDYGTVELVKDALTRLGCQYNYTEEEKRIDFMFQGAVFTIYVSNDAQMIVIRLYLWLSHDIEDIDGFSELRRIINEVNKWSDVTTIYNIDEKKNLVTVHSSTSIIFIPQIPHYEFYLKSVLQKFFEARNEVTNEFMKSRPMVEHS